METQLNPENAKWRAEDGKETEFSEESSAGLENEGMSPEEQINELNESYSETEKSLNELLERLNTAEGKGEHAKELTPADFSIRQAYIETANVYIEQMAEVYGKILSATRSKKDLQKGESFKLTDKAQELIKTSYKVPRAGTILDDEHHFQETAPGRHEVSFTVDQVRDLAEIIKKEAQQHPKHVLQSNSLFDRTLPDALESMEGQIARNVKVPGTRKEKLRELDDIIWPIKEMYYPGIKRTDRQ